jgi:formylglycine-generating enzyme required for sulfatase activity
MTPSYASPEACSDKVSRWSDQYSLAVTYCQLRGNQLPFDGPVAAVVAGHLMRTPNLERIPNAEERQVVARALAKEPQERWPSCMAFVAALAAEAKQSVAAEQTVPPVSPATPIPRWPRWLIPACGLALLAVGLVALLLAQLGQREQPRQPPPSNPPVLAKEIENKTLGMKLVLIPTGKFTMGSRKADPNHSDNEDVHEVEITKPFYMGKFEVTKGEFAKFVKATGYETDAEQVGTTHTWRQAETDLHPVAYVSWNDGVAFCDWLTQKEGKTYRLPTEAEWEYCCRAKTKTNLHSGDDEASLKKVANYSGNGHGATIAVGTLEANAFGLHDMHGNVWEWCQDWYDKDYYRKSPKRDPQGPGAGAFRVLRGGSYNNEDRYCLAAYRNYYEPANRYSFIGFRVVCVP